MSQLVIYAALLAQLVFISGVAGAPRTSASSAAVTSSDASNVIQHPKEEMELENLKHISRGLGDKSSSEEGRNATGNSETPTKPAVNQEHPAPSDNDNDNVEKFFSKTLSIRSSPLSFEERVAADLKESGNYNVNTDYTPQDIAEYIFWTGDEKGVALALNDFLQDDMVAKEDILRFLDDVKLELNVLRSRYSRMTDATPISESFLVAPSLDVTKLKSRFTQPPMYYLGKGPEKREMASGFESFPLDLTRNYIEDGQKTQGFYPSSTSGEESSDYEDMFEKLRQSDPKYRETSLREIIYELARELFAQELEDKPQKSIQRFAHFLENESAMGRIPKDLSKAVLDTLVGALVDAVSEQAKTWKPTQFSSGASIPGADAAISLTKSKISPDDQVKPRHSDGRKKHPNRK